MWLLNDRENILINCSKIFIEESGWVDYPFGIYGKRFNTTKLLGKYKTEKEAKAVLKHIAKRDNIFCFPENIDELKNDLPFNSAYIEAVTKICSAQFDNLKTNPGIPTFKFPKAPPIRIRTKKNRKKNQ